MWRSAAKFLALPALAMLVSLGRPGLAGAANGTSDPSVFEQPPADGGPVRYLAGVGYTYEMPPAAGLCKGVTGFGNRLDCWHDWLFVRMQVGVENTDHWLAGEAMELERVPLAPFRIGFDTEYLSRSDGAAFEFDLDIDSSLRLPNFERRMRIFLTSTRLNEAPEQPLDRDANVRAGLRFELPQSFDFDVGVRARIAPEFFAALSWRTVRYVGNWRYYPLARTYVETHDGLGLAAALNVDRWWHRVVARSTTYLNWNDDNDQIEWDQSVTFGYASHLLEDRRYAYLARGRDFAQGYGVSLSVSGSRIRGADSYRAMLFYKRPLRGRWLYWSLGPQVRWDREYGWNPDYGVRAGLDVLFWGLVDTDRHRRRTRAPLDSPPAL